MWHPESCFLRELGRKWCWWGIRLWGGQRRAQVGGAGVIGLLGAVVVLVGQCRVLGSHLGLSPRYSVSPSGKLKPPRSSEHWMVIEIQGKQEEPANREAPFAFEASNKCPGSSCRCGKHGGSLGRSLSWPHTAPSSGRAAVWASDGALQEGEHLSTLGPNQGANYFTWGSHQAAGGHWCYPFCLLPAFIFYTFKQNLWVWRIWKPGTFILSDHDLSKFSGSLSLSSSVGSSNLTESVLIDLGKGFDSANCKLLLMKLWQLGISCKSMNF